VVAGGPDLFPIAPRDADEHIETIVMVLGPGSVRGQTPREAMAVVVAKALALGGEEAISGIERNAGEPLFFEDVAGGVEGDGHARAVGPRLADEPMGSVVRIRRHAAGIIVCAE